MDLVFPIRSVVNTVRGPALAVLSRSRSPLTGREVARILGDRASQKGVLNALNEMVGEGIVVREDIPPAALFSLNRDHLAAAAIEELADLRQELYRRISEVVQSWPLAPIWVAVFGSTARGDGTSASDVDLVVLRSDDIEFESEKWYQQVDMLSERIRSWSGNEADVIQYSVSEFGELISAGSPLVDSLHAEAITLAGAAPWETAN